MSRLAMWLTAASAPGLLGTGDPIANAREATRVTTSPCRHGPGDDIMVCARRASEWLRLPLAASVPDREAKQRTTLLYRETLCQARGPFLIGCGGAGLSAIVGFGPGTNAGAIAVRPGLD